MPQERRLRGRQVPQYGLLARTQAGHIDFLPGQGIQWRGIPPMSKPVATTRWVCCSDSMLTSTSSGKYSDDVNTGKLDGIADDADADAAHGADGLPAQSLMGKWRTKGLRSIKETGPYFHNGQFATLLDVVKFYNDGGARLHPPTASCRDTWARKTRQ